MKVISFRLSVLAALVVLGWMTIAHAQRGSDDANPLRAARTAEGSASPDVDARNGRENAGSGRVASAPGDSIPDASALGLSTRQRAAAPSRYPTSEVSASVEASSKGPALMPNPSGVDASGSDRYHGRPMERRVEASGDAGKRYASSATPPESREPAPFRADPFAMPANQQGAVARQENDTVPSGPASLGGLSAEGEGSGQPGDQRLEGVQSPQLSIQKTAPREIQVGKPAGFRTTVRNTGTMPAGDVEIRDEVPRGTRLVSTNPQAKQGPRGELVWSLGTLRPGEELSVEMQVMPTAEGEIGSVASVRFAADASVRTLSTRPQLVIESSAPKRAMIGDQITLSITIANTGTGVATGVVLEERIPPGLQHPAGNELEYEVGELKPGESRKLELPLVAHRPGMAANLLSARGDGNLHAENQCELEIVAPQLSVNVDGPKRRYLERQATYQFSVTNPGTASAKQVELVAALPQGLKFVSANNAGYYEESTRTVRWRLEELPANETGSVELVTMPVEPGQHALKLRGTAQKGLIDEKEQPVLIEGIAAILFQVADTADPLEINGETTYEVRVVNQGSKAAGNVRLAVDLPTELKPVAADGPSRHALEGNRIVFDGLAALAPKAETSYRIRVKAMRSGDLRTRFQLMTDDMQTPVIKEESTRVYADE